MPTSLSEKLTYLDNHGLPFEGTAAFPFIGKVIESQGQKIDLFGASVTRSLNDYSKATYEREKMAKWRLSMELPAKTPLFLDDDD